MEATVDIGKNLTSLIERLAQQIGTTTDKVFPWYVQQAYLEGATALIGVAVVLAIFTPLFFWAFKKADFDNGDKHAVVAVVFGICTLLGFVGVFVEGPDAVRKLMNPNYYAMQMFTRDIGRLAGGR